MKINTIEKISFKWAAITFGLLSLYFLIMQAVGMIHVVELRILNAGIMFFGIYKAVKEAKINLREFNYFKGIGTGILTGGIASLIFAVFGLFYMTVLDTNFINEIKSNELFGSFINQYGATFQIFIEGTASGCLMSYAVMQYLKSPSYAVSR